jgi:hypothetical protein
MPGHDGGTTCRWHFHPIVVPTRGLSDCAEILPLQCCSPMLTDPLRGLCRRTGRLALYDLGTARRMTPRFGRGHRLP